ncbi:hypothetical protein D3C80_2157620 [compost metagenome]
MNIQANPMAESMSEPIAITASFDMASCSKIRFHHRNACLERLNAAFIRLQYRIVDSFQLI